VVFQKLALNGDLRNWEKIQSLALVFAIAIKGIKNGRVRIIKKYVQCKKGRGVGIPPFLTPKP